MTPGIVRIRAGTNRPVKFTMPSDFDMSGKTFELVLKWSGGERLYTEAQGLSKSGQNVTWNYSVADSRAFPEGRLAAGELQWTAAATQDSDTFWLEVEPGISND
jgi:hypothetical protein